MQAGGMDDSTKGTPMNAALAVLRSEREEREEESKKQRIDNPEARTEIVLDSSDDDDVPPVRSTWSCTACTLINHGSRASCEICEAPQPGINPPTAAPASGDGAWACATCTYRNAATDAACSMCSGSRSGSPPPLADEQPRLPDAAAALSAVLAFASEPSSSSASGGGHGGSATRRLQTMGSRQSHELVPFLDPLALYVNSLRGATFERGAAHARLRSPRTLSFADVCSGPVEKALITVFEHDLDFIAAHLPSTCQLTLVHTHGSAHGDANPVRWTQYRNAKYLRAPTPPPRESNGERAAFSGCMHAKLHLLRYADRLRVCVSTSNSCEGDWGHALQGTWICDFHKRGHTLGDRSNGGGGEAAGSGAVPSSFAAYLCAFVREACKLKVSEADPWERALLHDFDVTVPPNVHLVGSVPGDWLPNGERKATAAAPAAAAPAAAAPAAAAPAAAGAAASSSSSGGSGGGGSGSGGGGGTSLDGGLALGESTEVQGSGTARYTITNRGDGKLECTCPAFEATAKKKGAAAPKCKHIDALRAGRDCPQPSWGLHRLSALLREQASRFSDHHPILYQMSSLSLAGPWIRFPLQKAAQGGEGKAELRLVFPSVRRVLSSGGYGRIHGLGHLVFEKKNWWADNSGGYGHLRGCPPGCDKAHGTWAGAQHIKCSLFDLDPRQGAPAGRTAYLNHSKIMMRRDPATDRGWLLCGSANMSGSAWGSHKGGVLAIGLYELGVLLLDVAFAEYDLSFEYEETRMRRYEPERDVPGGGYHGLKEHLP